MNTDILQDVKRKIEELQELIVKLEQPQQTEEKKLGYINLSEGSNEDKLDRITEQIAKYKINILSTPKDSQLVRCALVSELREKGLRYWYIIRSMADNYDEAEQTKRYVYLMSRKDSIKLNFGVIINRYKAAIDLYNKNLNNKEHGNN